MHHFLVGIGSGVHLTSLHKVLHCLNLNFRRSLASHMSRCALSSTLSPPTVLSLKAATTPSREACDALVRTRSSHIKRKTHQKEDTSFMAPAPRNAAESRAWNRMSTRMEGTPTHFCVYLQSLLTDLPLLASRIPLSL